MSNLLNFFFSFDKLMKEKLVIAFFWLGIINIGLLFFAGALSAINLGPLAGLMKFFQFFVKFVLAIVSLRLVAEVAVAIFRINNNLSPDGGKSETADIDPIEEARKAAEHAAKRAREVSKSAVERTSSGSKTKAKPRPQKPDAPKPSAPKPSTQKSSTQKPSATPKAPAPAKAQTASAKTASTKTASAKKAPTKKTVVKKAPAKKTPVKSTPTKSTSAKSASAKSTSGARLKKDGTPAKRPGPKPKS